jgi:opacity protein-like surface antigen
MKPLIFLFLITISLSVLAQDSKYHFEFPDMSRGLGASFQKFDGLNSRIANFPQYKTVMDQTGTLQLGWFKEQHQFITDMELGVGSSMSGNRDTRSSVIRYYGLNANIGYDVIKAEKILLYPLVGIGFQRYQARFYKDNSGVSIENVLQSPTVQSSLRPVDFTNLFLTYRLALGFAVKTEKCKWISSVGIQAGYAGSFKSQAWKTSDNQSLANAPEDKLSQYFATLILTSKPWFMKHMK